VWLGSASSTLHIEAPLADASRPRAMRRMPAALHLRCPVRRTPRHSYLSMAPTC
jgi:hypothetical protein